MKLSLRAFFLVLLLCEAYGSNGRYCHKSKTTIPDWHVYSLFCYVSGRNEVWHAERCPSGSVRECKCLSGDPSVGIHSSIDADGCNCWFRSSTSKNESFTMIVKCPGNNSCQKRIDSALADYQQSQNRYSSKKLGVPITVLLGISIFSVFLFITANFISSFFLRNDSSGSYDLSRAPLLPNLISNE